ncbi:M48 family metalloprotease [Pseudooceanicola algae]|uniref:M48 family metalloprotease n=1 Tax=Pseudooceanicola algae TaxID=1537215 RepID=UPI001E4F6D1C|nr:M48 family metalloprotease [Pseudooceanicola algae]
MTVLRDPDIEHALNRLAQPVLRAAGLSSALKVLVVQDPSLNAFVVDPNAIYIHSGLLQRTSSAAALQFIIAHEAAHIANGHLTRRRLNAQYASRVAGLGMALAVATAAGTGQPALAAAGLGVANSARRGFFAHSRAEESSADQSAIRYLSQSGRGARGAIDAMQIFAGQETLSESRRDPYAQSHPVSRDRLRSLTALSQSYGPDPRLDVDQDTYWYERAKGKISAFLQPPKWTRQRADESLAPDIEYMRLAVANHRLSDWRGAVQQLDRALAIRPDDAYYHELKGQILLEGRQFAAAEAAYRRASTLAPNDGLILASLGHAMVVQGGTARLQQALPVLERARAADYRNGGVMRDLGSAYAQLGQPGMAALSIAEYHALYGRLKDAGIQARRAEGLLSRGSPSWQRARDVVVASENAEKP